MKKYVLLKVRSRKIKFTLSIFAMLIFSISAQASLALPLESSIHSIVIKPSFAVGESKGSREWYKSRVISEDQIYEIAKNYLEEVLKKNKKDNIKIYRDFNSSGREVPYNYETLLILISYNIQTLDISGRSVNIFTISYRPLIPTLTTLDNRYITRDRSYPILSFVWSEDHEQNIKDIKDTMTKLFGSYISKINPQLVQGN